MICGKVVTCFQSLEILCTNYEAELQEGFSTELGNYTELFNPIKDKINKRKRKLLDFDDARHHFETTKSAKKQDDLKMTKVRW